MQKHAGFTLVELLITIAVMAVLAAVAVPNFMGWLPKYRVQGAARELFTDLHLARMKAISENNNYVITFDTSGNAYSIYDDGDDDFASAGAESGELVKTVTVSDKYSGIAYGSIEGSGVTFSGSPKRVIFYPTGMASVSGSVYLIPTEDLSLSRTDRQRKITVMNNGRIRLYQYRSGGWE